MRIAVVGSRNFPDLELVREYVRALPDGVIVVSGSARGVDRTAEDEARKRGLVVESHPPAWRKLGKYDPTAGFARNSTIIERADRVVAFHDGSSKGTLDTVSKAVALGLPVAVFGPRSRRSANEQG